MDRLRRLLIDHPELLSRQPLLKFMLAGLEEEQASGVARILEIMIRRRARMSAVDMALETR